MPQSKIRRIRKFLIFLFVCSFLLSGCEYKEIDKDAFISKIGIDQSDDPDKPYKVTFKIYLPTSSFKQNPQPEYLYLSKNGKTLTEAFRLLESHSDKKLQFGHAKVIIIGEKLLQSGKGNEIMDLLLRRPDIQMIAWIAAGRPNAETIVRMTPADETAAYPSLFNYFDHNGTESPYIVSTYLFDFRRRMVEEGIDAIIPIIETDEQESQFIIDKSYVMSKDRNPFELSPLDTLLYNIITQNTDRADVVINEDDHYFIGRIDDINSKYKVKEGRKGEVTIGLNVGLYGYISESKQDVYPKDLKFYNKLVQQESNKKFTAFLKKMQKEGYDPIGFGLRYKASRNPHHQMSHTEWNEAYKNAKIDLSITAGIKSTGTIQ